jgi:hypothetical protein
MITGTPWSGPLFFGLKPNRSGSRLFSRAPAATGEPMTGSDVAG